MPAIHPVAGGFCGSARTRDFFIYDEEIAYIVPAKMMAATVSDPPADGAGAAQEVPAQLETPYSIPHHLKLWRDLAAQGPQTAQ